MKPNTPGFIGSRLKVARDARGLSGENLAARIGITRQAISSYELGESSPRPEVLRLMSEVLGLPIDYFCLPENASSSDSVDTTVFYRSLSAATKNARQSSQARFKWFRSISAYLSEFVEFPAVNFPDFSLPDTPEQISVDDIESIAEDTRHFWNLNYGPISNIVWLLENNGAFVGRYSLNASELDAFSQLIDSRPFFILNSDKDCAVRSRFDIAHELGHIVLHRNMPKPLYSLREHFKLMEDQAHRFAGAFLFPRRPFIEEVLSPDLDFFSAIKQRWGVSIAAMLMRSKDLGLVNEIEAQSLWRKYSRQGFKRKEPWDDKIPVEKPRIVAESFKVIVHNNIQSV